MCIRDSSLRAKENKKKARTIIEQGMGNCYRRCLKRGGNADNKKGLLANGDIEDHISMQGDLSSSKNTMTSTHTLDESDVGDSGLKMAKPIKIKNRESIDTRVSVSDFNFLKIVGKGSFGKVILVEKKGVSNKLYAMKILKKDQIERRNQKVHTKAEREILENMESPFIIQLHYAFQTPEKLYMVMEFMQGG
eukprot:TRINITY_DN7558_c0_g1_i8.p1 TRINITY_DN7558_c0_g1~~TRINITY_DN7558_c0_g1_i8.p1  ORF type:complete len:192 (-),score=46.58 TRINITY_DN7558_c0_g1_i8:356-931(-)